uniref:Chromosome 3 open reading frame 38 n=1 Tax=Xenopus tropicalis TaxID=8364 RepID=A0A803K8R2_XENTR
MCISCLGLMAENYHTQLIPVISFSTKEAMDAILTYSKNAAELLNRRKVYRDIIFKYLAAKKIAVSPSSEKNQLIQRALEFWRESATESVSSAPESSSFNGQNSVPSQDKSNDTSHSGSLDCQLLGEHFCRWFYPLLNSQNPILGCEKGYWGPQHFWENTVLKFAYRTTQESTEEYCGAQMASLRLLALTREERLLFNPSIDTGGLKCAISRHGLVVVAVAGTIHRDNQCLGIFEQIFGLIRCPVTASWKIKNVNLKILGQSALGALGSIESAPRPSIQYKTKDLEEYYS